MKFKLSKYVEVTSLSNSSQSFLLYALRTGKKIWLPSTVVEALKNGEFNELENQVLEVLKSIEVIVPWQENELETLILRNQKAAINQQVLYLAIQPTANCQLGCNYCGQQHTRKKMSQLVEHGIVRRIENKLRNSQSQYTRLLIGWFGAEPLLGMPSIRSLSTELIQLASKYECEYSAKIVTNGLALKYKVFEELVNLQVKKIEITLDGTKDSHDIRRATKAGNNTFDVIFNNLLQVVNSSLYDQSGTHITIRCNVDKDNYKEVDELIDLLASHDLQEKIVLYFAPIHSWGNDAHLNSLEREQFAQKEVKWLAKLYAKGFYLSCLTLPNAPKKIVCMATSKTGEIVDAYGNIFNCSEFPYVPTYGKDVVIGNVQFNPIDNFSDKRLFTDWDQDILLGMFPCMTCKMLPICGGSCPKSWYEGHLACPSFKHNIQDRLMIETLAVREINNSYKKKKKKKKKKQATSISI